MNTAKKFTGLDMITVGFLIACFAQPAHAGWSGAMNGVGYGQATVNVRAYDTSKLKTRYVSTTNMVSPSAAITITDGYVFGAPLPDDASAATVAKVKGLPGYIWQATTVGSDGDSTDNFELENRIKITAADCASLEMTSEAAVAPEGNSGTITVNAKATAGTALWTRGIEFTGDPSLLPPDDPQTGDVNETVEFLKTNVNSSLKWDLLLVGPFDLSTPNCNALTIPFTIETDIENLYFITDGVAKSLPLVIECPPDIVVDCQQPVKYPETVQAGGCGKITVSFYPPSPALDGSFPAGAFKVGTTPVTVTATDKDGNSTTCTFNVIVTDTTPPVVPTLDTLTGEASVTVPQPSPVIDNCGGTANVSTTNSLFYDTQGTFTVYWNFDDSHGNTNTVEQIVIVDDVTAPVAPTLATVTGQCSATVTVPTASDSVVGDVTGTTSDPTTYTQQGTYTITWTFNDGNGNSSTAKQTVIVQDTIPPVKPTLPDLTFETCTGTPAMPPAPTTTDNCAGTVTGTTTTVFPISALGTTVVTWTFNDGNGKTTTATQNITVTGLTLRGFYSPIGTQGNECASTTVSVNKGSSIPIKFDMMCGTSTITTGPAPTVKIEEFNANCAATLVTVISPAEYQNDWHINWDTSPTKKNHKYRVSVIRNGVEVGYVWIKVK